MIEFFLALIVVGILIAGMAVGVLLGRKPLAGSCGGMSAIGMDVACDICGGDETICEEIQEQERQGSELHASHLAYDAASMKRDQKN